MTTIHHAAQTKDDLQRRLTFAEFLLSQNRKLNTGTLTANARFSALLRALLRIVEPQIIAGREVPIGEVLMDARWGHMVLVGQGGEHHPEIFDRYPVHANTHHLAHPYFFDALGQLEGISVELIDPLVTACVMALEERYGPLKYIAPDQSDPDDLLRLVKVGLHTLAGNDRPCSGMQDWRLRMAHIARAHGVHHLNLLSRLARWLPVTLAKRPRWMR